jgi:hypothetical protein
MRASATWFGVFGVLFLAVGLVLDVTRTSIAGYRVWPGALMLIGLVCLLVCVAASGPSVRTTATGADGTGRAG